MVAGFRKHSGDPNGISVSSVLGRSAKSVIRHTTVRAKRWILTDFCSRISSCNSTHPLWTVNKVSPWSLCLVLSVLVVLINSDNVGRAVYARAMHALMAVVQLAMLLAVLYHYGGCRPFLGPKQHNNTAPSLKNSIPASFQ
ncbi:unnamed protein product [Polarella glacialis]|uniref:Uncharacterized protein n=1 Tax=Polarella glacialis TaxID=89957 RepID=A0A813FGX1_POLGL|nr:unnamed protein product [Polarella glacialis]